MIFAFEQLRIHQKTEESYIFLKGQFTTRNGKKSQIEILTPAPRQPHCE